MLDRNPSPGVALVLSTGVIQCHAVAGHIDSHLVRVFSAWGGLPNGVEPESTVGTSK